MVSYVINYKHEISDDSRNTKIGDRVSPQF